MTNALGWVFFFILDLHPSSKMPSVKTVWLWVKERCVSLCSLCCCCCSTAKHSWIPPRDPWGSAPCLCPVHCFFCTFFKGGGFKAEQWSRQTRRVSNSLRWQIQVGLQAPWDPKALLSPEVSPLRGMVYEGPALTDKPFILPRDVPGGHIPTCSSPCQGHHPCRVTAS